MTREEEIKCAAANFAIEDTETNGRVRKNYVISAMADHENGFNEGFVAGANWADNYPRENADRVQAAEMDVWIARDEDGQLAMYDNDPHKWRDYFYSSGNKRNSYLKLPTSMCPEVKFENSPVKMRLILEQ
jgi:hypothetical protein